MHRSACPAREAFGHDRISRHPPSIAPSRISCAQSACAAGKVVNHVDSLVYTSIASPADDRECSMSDATGLASTFDLGGKLAVVTGAGSGLGRRFAEVLARAGAAVVLCGRRREPLEETRRSIRDGGGMATVLTMDVTDEKSVRNTFEQIVTDTGIPDILVNNAGVDRPMFATELSADDWDSVLDTNLKGCFLVAREFARRLIDAGRQGNVVNVASILGFRAQKAVSAYMASKAGLLHLNRALALEWAKYGIRVNALVPGYFR